ncbi:MAG: mevalonate kinase [Candidatus ainarchaeum sp.]|nr:mevalonate kinase [Candidatus ainarchaeum sp.]
MGKGYGCAKSILFGEHFVVYGLPAIGVGLSKKIEVEISKAPHTLLESSHVDANLLAGLDAIKNAMGIKDNFVIRIKSEIPVASGLGSSAAVSVAFVRALSEEYKLNLSDEKVNAYAFEAEKVYHGNPSGMDNNLAMCGGAIIFQKKPEGASITPLRIGKPMNLVIGVTGKKKKSTAQLIAEVKLKKEKYPELFHYLFEAEKNLIDLAIKAIEHGKLEEVGELMNLNQGFLSAMGVSSRENKDIIYAAREMGALGAKITGAGYGGSCVILAKNEKNAEEIAEEIRRLGYVAITTVAQ